MLVSRSLRLGELEDGRAFMGGSTTVVDVVGKKTDALVLMKCARDREGRQVEEKSV